MTKVEELTTLALILFRFYILNRVHRAEMMEADRLLTNATVEAVVTPVL